MTMKKTVLLSIVFFLYIQSAVSQELPTIIPPSPTAYELGKFGQIPVGLFSGTPNINIPLHSFNSGDVTVPISLSYNSNGIKVDQISSDVGLGWSLNAGGVITRILRDEVDETYRVNLPEINYASEDMRIFLSQVNNNQGQDTQPGAVSTTLLR